MAYFISDDCVKCGSCAAQCPVEAISEGPDKFVIDPDACLECGACAAQCPAEAIDILEQELSHEAEPTEPKY